MAGALDEINRLLDTTGGMKKQAYDEGRTANADYQRLLQKPGTDRSGLAFAAGLLKGGQGGNFGAELGQALGYYDKSAGDYENRELERQEKIMRLRAANAALTGGYADDLFGLGMKRFDAPDKALNYQYGLDALEGKTGIPVYPGGGGDPTLDPPLVPPGDPDDPDVSAAPPATPPNPNATVGQGPQSFAPYQVAGTDWQPPPTQPSGVQPDPQAPSEYPPELPMRMAQAQAGQPAQARSTQPQPSPADQRMKQLYDWSLQVMEAQARDPIRWSRRRENQQAVQRAQQILAHYRAMNGAGRGIQTDPEYMQIQKEKARQELIKAQRENDPNAPQRPTEKMRGDLAAARRAADALETEFSNYENLVKKYGAEVAPTEGKAELNTAYTNLLMRLKNVYELGAITGPDEKLLNNLLMNTAVNDGWDAMHKWINPEGRVKAQIAQLKTMVKNDLDAAEKATGVAPRDKQPVLDTAVGKQLTPDEAAELEALLALKRQRQQKAQ